MGSWGDFQSHFRRFRSYELTFMPVPYLSVNLKILDIPATVSHTHQISGDSYSYQVTPYRDILATAEKLNDSPNKAFLLLPSFLLPSHRLLHVESGVPLSQGQFRYYIERNGD